MHVTTTNEKRNGNFEKARKVCWRFWRRESEGEVMEVCYNLKNKHFLKEDVSKNGHNFKQDWAIRGGYTNNHRS